MLQKYAAIAIAAKDKLEPCKYLRCPSRSFLVNIDSHHALLHIRAFPAVIGLLQLSGIVRIRL